MWLLYVALTTVFPDADAVRRVRRGLSLRSGGDAVRWLLATALPDAQGAGVGAVDLVVVDRGVVVDVDFTARHTLNTGVQRVVREVLPRWDAAYPLTLAAWTLPVGGLRALTPGESDLVLRWQGDPGLRRPAPPPRPTLVVPWRSTVVLPEVPPALAAPRLAALAALSGNRAVAIGHDCIPVVSASLLAPAEPERFARYLEVVKHLQVVAGVSASAAGEFAGFASMLPSQGLTGPEVVCVREPVATPTQAPPPPPPTVSGEPPLVLVVGTLDARKNPLAVLYAAERLWREGLEFRLQLVAGGGRSGRVGRRIAALSRAGRRVAVASSITDEALDALYAEARFTVFVSLHEGFGLPLAESLAQGVPAVTTAYGSTGELAAGGGALVVDPRDDEAVLAAMRRLLTDDAELEALRAAARARSPRGWDAYADEVWQVLVPPAVRAVPA